MSEQNTITLVIAIYGAVISTIAVVISAILGYREWQRDKKQVKVTIEYVEFNEVANLIIANIGYRPITITQIVMIHYKKSRGKKHYFDPVPARAMFEESSNNVLPKTLKDGEQIKMQFSEILRDDIMNHEKRVAISVLDAEGHSYSTCSENVLWSSAKWNYPNY